MRDWTDVGVLLVCALVAPACGRGVPSASNPVPSASNPVPPASDPVPSASNPCAGLTPSLPPAKTFTVTTEDEGGLYCGLATSDGLGNLYFEGSFFTIKSSTGAVVSAQTLFAPLASGCFREVDVTRYAVFRLLTAGSVPLSRTHQWLRQR